MNKYMFITALDDKSPNKVAYDIAKETGVEKIFFVKNKKKADYFKDIQTERISFTKLFKLEGLLHSHGLIPDFISACVSFFNKKVKFVSTVHSVIDADLKESKSKYIAFFAGKAWVFSLKRFDYVVCLNNQAKACLKERGVCENKIKIIKNGLNINLVEADIKLDSKNNSSVNIASWSVVREMKGHQYTISALLLDNALNFILAGDGPYLKHLKCIADDLAVIDRCEFMGHQSCLSAIIKKADVFVMPSAFEGVPIALFEAVANRIPCVCNDIGPLRELFSDDEVVFCDVKNTHEYKRSINKAYKLKNKLTYNAFKKLTENYTKKVMGEHYLGVYNGVQ